MSGFDSRYVPTGRRRRRSSSRARSGGGKLAVPVAIALGMVVIPMLSIEMTRTGDSNVAHAEERTAPSDNNRNTELGSLETERYRGSRSYSGKIRTLLRDDQIESMKAAYLRSRDASMLRHELNAYANDIASGNYIHIPQEIRQIVRQYMSDGDIRDVKQWLQTRRPQARDLMHTAKIEFAPQLESISDELMLSRDEVAQGKVEPRRTPDAGDQGESRPPK